MTALVIGVLACASTVATFTLGAARDGRDFTYWWRAGHALLDGLNPYLVIRPDLQNPYPYNGIFAYPLPAAFVGVPFTPFPVILGAGFFVGAGFALAAYGLLGMGAWRLLVLASAPAYVALITGQWSPLLLGAALVPSFGWLLACKPTIGAALFLWHPTRRAFLGGAVLLAIAFVVLPTWPLDWLAALRRDPFGVQYLPPLMMPGGIVLFLALLRWRRPEARLLGALACIPQNPLLYDQLALMMIPSGPWSLAAFAAWTHVVYWGTAVLIPPQEHTWLVYNTALQPILVACIYFPCLAMLLLRPNEGDVPAWAERALARIPRWLRGQPAAERA